MSVESVSRLGPGVTLSLRRPPGGVTRSVADLIGHSRKATWSRVASAATMGGLSIAVLPWTHSLVWIAFMTAWEVVLRPFLEDRIVLPIAERSEQRGFMWLAGIHLIGASAYSIFPAATWSTNTPIGMVLATAWVCGSANHLFIYFSSNRLVLAACITPLVCLSLAAPFLANGPDMTAGISVVALISLIFAAGAFGFDRQVLLAQLARQAAARAAAEEANKSKSQFLATMSHELRTPLNSVIGYAELIGEESNDDAITGDAEKIKTSARQLLGVIDVILDVSKLEAGTIALEHERIALSGVMTQLKQAAAPLAAQNNNKLIVGDAEGEAELDHLRVHQCLMHLISNAAKFTKNGEIRITARRTAAGMVEFVVADTGIGIAPEHQARIFEPFAQVEGDHDRRFEGAGLGLALVRRLARLMGGDVTCHSTLGEGATFTLSVPGHVRA
ncbi:MAG: HAMP domain-containing histidine kinase [Hyphomonadaceae bacterium]|nr:HAMP domain-containing histidine kinase [Hyphomonadaceae bacterium]